MLNSTANTPFERESNFQLGSAYALVVARHVIVVLFTIDAII